VEYRVNSDLTVRMGGVWDQDPVPGDKLSPLLPDEDRYVISMGLSYDMGFAILDVSYQHIFFRSADKNNDVGDADSSLVNPADGDYKSDAHMFGLGIRADF
jgi:long-subunit fatty acid transport protein